MRNTLFIIFLGQVRAEEAFPHIGDLQGAQVSTNSELPPLHARADAAAARLDRLSVQTATATKDISDQRRDHENITCELRGKIAEEVEMRKEVEVKWQGMMNEAAEVTAAATRALAQRTDQQIQNVMSEMKALEERLIHRMDEQSQRLLKESKRGDVEVAAMLRPEIQTVQDLVQRRYEEATEQSEILVRATQTELRNEIETTSSAVKASGERNVEQKATELMGKMNLGFEACQTRTESVREGAENALHEAVKVLRQEALEVGKAQTKEANDLRNQIKGVENRCLQACDEAERRAVDASTRRLEDVAGELRGELSDTKMALTNNDENLRDDMSKALRDASAKLEANINDMGGACNNVADKALSRAVVTLRSELAEGIKNVIDRCDNVRCSVLSALGEEVQARTSALVAEASTRTSLGRDICSEMQRGDAEVTTLARSLSCAVDHRVDASNDEIKSLQRNQEQARKEHADDVIAIRGQLRNERQLTEEVNAEIKEFVKQVRDEGDARLTSEAAEIRTALGECRKRLHDEAAGLHAELRGQPTRAEVQEVQKDISQRYAEISTSLSCQRAKLDAAVADFSVRSREVRNESSEARLQMQRETLQLGREITNLRAASTSLANGVVKAVQVLGFVQHDEETMGKLGLDGAKRVGIEVEDLLEWEKVGKSLSARIGKTWYPKEAAGVASVLTMIEQKAEEQELVVLRALLRECAPGSFSALSAGFTPVAPPGIPPAKTRPQYGISA